MVVERQQLNEGKTKIIWSDLTQPFQVVIESKNDITAGDGVKHDQLENKRELANEVTCNCFELLETNGIKTHYVSRESDHSFRAHKAVMVPIECVARRVATGSYLKRNPHTEEGERFDPLVVEFFFKDDSLHDPLIVHDFVRRKVLFFQPKVPMKKGFMMESPLDNPSSTFKMLQQLREFVVRVFEVLEKAWAKQDVQLVDLKIECGYIGGVTEHLVVADVIDNDSWRIWPQGDKAQEKSKQVYRDAKDSSPETMAKLVKNYAWVANATSNFLD